MYTFKVFLSEENKFAQNMEQNIGEITLWFILIKNKGELTVIALICLLL